MLRADDLLARYDAQLRAHVPERLPAGAVVERDGPLVRTFGAWPQGWVEYRDLGDLDEAALDALIARQVARFRELGLRFEWKLHSHDRPPFLADRLVAAGFVPQDLEAVLVAKTAVVPPGEPPAGVTVREVREPDGYRRIGELEAAVWGDDRGWAESFAREAAADPDGLATVVAEADGLVVSAGWVRFPSGTEFATFWGGATLPDRRGRGIYRAVVAERARLAAARGRRYLEVDALPTSRPILERLGFRAVTETRPYVWTP